MRDLRFSKESSCDVMKDVGFMQLCELCSHSV
jgi:hypothetical protein